MREEIILLLLLLLSSSPPLKMGDDEPKELNALCFEIVRVE